MLWSILDNDLYKFTMQQAVLDLYPDAEVEYRFTNRRPTDTFNDKFLSELRAAIANLSRMSSNHEEIQFLKSRCPYFKPHYLDYLYNFRYRPDDVDVYLDENEQLVCNINGPWHRTILWEVPLMAMISELYFVHCKTAQVDTCRETQELACLKGQFLNTAGCRWADFGTRRRRSGAVQDILVDKHRHYSGFIGTSNVHHAYRYNVQPVGTMAHEWIMGVSALESLRHANRVALERWHQVYGGKLGIALTDTYTTDVFFRDFDDRLARLYDGLRQDSGCPFEFIDKTVSFYESVNIPSTSKTIVFSDGLTSAKAVEIHRYAQGKINPVFGIGTHFTNDFSDHKALNIVIKLWSVNGTPVVKLSDDDGKAQGDPDAVRVAKWTFLGRPLDAKNASMIKEPTK